MLSGAILIQVRYNTLMSGQLPLDLRRILGDRITHIRTTRFFNDRLSLSIMVLALAFNALTFAVVIAKLRPTDLPIPVHYSSLSGYDQLGAWYQGYLNAAYATILTLVNLVLAYRSFNRSRITSFFLLVGAVVAAMFCLIITNALTALV